MKLWQNNLLGEHKILTKVCLLASFKHHVTMKVVRWNNTRPNAWRSLHKLRPISRKQNWALWHEIILSRCLDKPSEKNDFFFFSILTVSYDKARIILYTWIFLNKIKYMLGDTTTKFYETKSWDFNFIFIHDNFLLLQLEGNKCKCKREETMLKTAIMKCFVK